MNSRKILIGLIPVLLFGLISGYFCWYIFMESPAHRYRLDFSGARWITTGKQNPDGYFAKEIFIPDKVADAWVSLAASDGAGLYINGKLVSNDSFAGANVSAIYDITGMFMPGKNVIGVSVARKSYPGVPVLLLKGGYADMSGRTHLFYSGSGWKVSPVQQTQGQGDIQWTSSLFNHSLWAAAVDAGGPVKFPVFTSDTAPYITGRPLKGYWIWYRSQGTKRAFFKKKLKLNGRPRDAYFGIADNIDYQLAINNIVVANSAGNKGRLNIYSISTFLHPGVNTLSIRAQAMAASSGLFAHGTPPGLFMTGYIKDGRQKIRLQSDSTWLAADIRPIESAGSKNGSGWELPWIIDKYPSPVFGLLTKSNQEIELPMTENLRITVLFSAFVVGVALTILVLWTGFAVLLSKIMGESDLHEILLIDGIFHVPSLIFLLFVYAMSFDIGHDTSWPFQMRFVLLALAAVFLLRGVYTASAVLHHPDTQRPAGAAKNAI